MLLCVCQYLSLTTLHNPFWKKDFYSLTYLLSFKVRNYDGSVQPLADLSHAASSLRLPQPQFAGTGRSLGFDFPDFDPSFSTSQMFGRNVNMVPLKNDEVMVPAPVFIPEKWWNKDWYIMRLENKF